MVGPAVFVMIFVVLSQQIESRELLAGRNARGCGAHLRKQVQGSDAHGTGGVGHFPIMLSHVPLPPADRMRTL